MSQITRIEKFARPNPTQLNPLTHKKPTQDLGWWVMWVACTTLISTSHKKVVPIK